ncbi:MAG: hypothetical protein AAFP02_01685, partial [Bacteroidota bacterium]
LIMKTSIHDPLQNRTCLIDLLHLQMRQWEQITDSSPLYEQSTWFRALAHLQMEQIDQARAILQGIVDTGFHYQLAEAEALLKVL